jgi:hypothetical protein
VTAEPLVGTDEAFHDPTGFPNYGDSAVGQYHNLDATVAGTRFDLNGSDIPDGATIDGVQITVITAFFDGTPGTAVCSFQETAAPATFNSGDTPYDRWNAGTKTAQEFTHTIASDAPGGVTVWDETDDADMLTALQEVIDDTSGALESIVWFNGESPGGSATNFKIFAATGNATYDPAEIIVDYTAAGGFDGALMASRQFGGVQPVQLPVDVVAY